MRRGLASRLQLVFHHAVHAGKSRRVELQINDRALRSLRRRQSGDFWPGLVTRFPGAYARHTRETAADNLPPLS